MSISRTKRSSRRVLIFVLAAMAIAVVAGSVVIAAFVCSEYTSCSCSIRVEPSDLFTIPNLTDRYQPYGYVAHALGGIDGAKYTNSREAFLSSYAKGFRIFEVDLVLLKDGSVLCAHDNSEWMYGLDKPFAESTTDDMSGRLCLGSYTPLNGRALLDLIQRYPSTHFILDTKYDHHDILRTLVAEAKLTDPSVLERVIPHIAGPYDLCKVAQIHPFRDYMLALYRWECNPYRRGRFSQSEIIEFVRESSIRAVMMEWNTIYSPDFKDKLNDAGAAVYVHSLNDPDTVSTFRQQGVGVYTNGYFPS